MPPHQRAVLVLRDVLGYRAAEVAEMLGSTEASVNSALQRARAALDAAPERARRRAAARLAAPSATLLARFADAFERGDVDAVVALLTDDAWIRMPPEPHEYQGRPAIAAFLRDRGRLDAPGAASAWCPPGPTASRRSATTWATRRPASARAGGLLVLTRRGRRRSRAITRFGDTGVLPWFGLPRTIPG